MKAFFEEYGFILVSVVVMIALIGLVSGSGGITDKIKDQSLTMVDTLTGLVDKE